MSRILHGDAFTELQKLDDNSIDLLCTDPPYGYQFMNKDWDKAVIPTTTWRECLRVLKPGAFAFIMSSPRQDVLGRMIYNLQEAGFRTDFTSLYHTYPSGFPKAKNLKDGSYAGWQPKPAVEVVLVVMKPLSEKSFTDQALVNGKGISWLDDCRIPYQSEDDNTQDRIGSTFGSIKYDTGERKQYYSKTNLKGRFPANLLVSDSVLGSDYSRYFDLDKWFDTTFPFLIIPKASKAEKEKGLDQWIPKPLPHNMNMRCGNCGLLILDSRSETCKCIEKKEIRQTAKNFHPTVKPIKLMSYLIMLGSCAGDLVLDPFCGSGTTCIASQQLKRQWIGIELNPDYVKIAEKRLDPYLLHAKLFS